MTQGNRTIQDHEDEDHPRELHVFEANDTELTYIGQFRYHDHYQADAPEFGSGEIRKVIVFRLEQISGEHAGPTRTRLDRLGHEPVKEVPVESQLTETTLVEGNREEYTSERREQRLVLAFVETLAREGHDICRMQFRPEGEAAALFCDLYDKSTRTLYEAKGTVTRTAIRTAIGQLADYGRFVDDPSTHAVLLPEEPRPDLKNLMTGQGLTVVWQERDGSFERLSPQ